MITTPVSADSRSRILQLLGIVVVIVATPLAAVYYQIAMKDPDIWWRLRVGEYILSTRSFPHTAIFSRFAATNAWETHSWLFDVLISLAYRWFSLPGLPVFLFIFQIAIVAALLSTLATVARSTWMGIFLAAITLAACFHTLSPRAVLFTILLFILELALVFRDLRDRRIRAMYWMPLIFFIWANCHIQFLNGLLVLGAFCACEFLQYIAARRWNTASPDLPWPRLFAIFAGCIVATLLNPYTWHMYEVIWGYLTKTGQWDQIIELLAPNFRRPAHYIELLLAGAAAWSLGTTRTHSLFRVCLLLMSAVVSLHAVREAWMLSIVAAFLIAEAWPATAREADQPGTLPFTSLAIASVLAFCLCMAAQAQIGFTNARLIAELDRFFPVRAASFMAEARPPGPLYNGMNWGGYLVYNLREYPVSIDGRNEAFGGDIGASLSVMQAMPGWKQDPTFSASNVFLIENNLPLARQLASDSDFQLIYQDHLAVVFARKTPR